MCYYLLLYVYICKIDTLEKIVINIGNICMYFNYFNKLNIKLIILTYYVELIY